MGDKLDQGIRDDSGVVLKALSQTWSVHFQSRNPEVLPVSLRGLASGGQKRCILNSRTCNNCAALYR